MHDCYQLSRQRKKAEAASRWVLLLVGLSHWQDAFAAPPLPRISGESGCRVALDSSAHSSDTEPLRVYVRGGKGRQPVPYAVLELQPRTASGQTEAGAPALESNPETEPSQESEKALPDGASNKLSADPFPYQVTAGTLVERQGASCRSLVGMVAVPQHRDPFFKASASSATTPQSDLTAGTLTDEPKPGMQQPSSPLPAAPPASVPGAAATPDSTPLAPPAQPVKETESQITSPTDQGQGFTASPADQPPSEDQSPQYSDKPFLALFAGLRGEMSQLQGLYIDANIDTSLLFIGPQLRLSLTPLVLFVDSPFADGLQITYVYHSGESLQELKIRRDDQDVGNQESSLMRQEMRLGYGLSYLESVLSTRLDLFWANQKLRHSARFKAGVEGAGSSLRDLETTCLGTRLTQSYTLPRLFTVLASLGYCLSSEAETPAITAAEFPNASTRFEESTEADLSLGLSVPVGENSPVTFDFALTARGWVGALTLTEGQIIDSGLTQFGFSLGFTQSL